MGAAVIMRHKRIQKIGVLAAIRGGNVKTLSKQTADCGPGIQIGALPLLLETITVDTLAWLAECYGDSEVRDPTCLSSKNGRKMR